MLSTSLQVTTQLNYDLHINHIVYHISWKQTKDK